MSTQPFSRKRISSSFPSPSPSSGESRRGYSFLFCATLCYSILCYAILCYAMLCVPDVTFSTLNVTFSTSENSSSCVFTLGFRHCFTFAAGCDTEDSTSTSTARAASCFMMQRTRRSCIKSVNGEIVKSPFLYSRHNGCLLEFIILLPISNCNFLIFFFPAFSLSSGLAFEHYLQSMQNKCIALFIVLHFGYYGI